MVRYRHFQKEGFAYVDLLKSCAKNKDLYKGTRLHADILQRGLLGKSPYVAASLISMYVKCGVLSKAHQVLDSLPVRDVVSWNALIGGYAQQGQGHAALNCFYKMQKEGLSPDAVTFTCIAKACGSTHAVELGTQIHDVIVARDLLHNNAVLGNSLVDMYAKFGMLSKAQEVLDSLPVRNVVSWSSLIAGYAKHGLGHEALKCFEEMQSEGLTPDAITFACILKACATIRAIDRGKEIHDQIDSMGLLGGNVFLGTALVDMYAKCGVLWKAQELLDELPIRDLVSWSSLISGYAQHGQHHNALNCYEIMQMEGLAPDAVMFISILKACGVLGAIEKGKRIHDEIVHRCLLEREVALGTALVDMYARCGALDKAQKVHDELTFRDIVSWNALISGYVQEGQGGEGLKCFSKMQREGLVPDTITFTLILKACGSEGAVEKGKQIHDEIVNRGLLEKNIVLGTSLVDMYVKCDMLAKAQQVLNEFPVHDVISLNAVISGYAQLGEGHEALNCFEKMQNEGLSPSSVTFLCILKACGDTGAIEKGKWIHDEVVTQGLLAKDVALGTALVDMYAKCGLLEKAKEVLHELPYRNAGCWNALISGYAQQGQGHEALTCFEQMKKENINPDAVTILCVLTACSHAGLADEAEMFYQDISRIHDMILTLEHQTCMVDVFGSAGHFDKAVSVIKEMKCFDHPPVWLALLGACRKWGNVKLGCLSFDQAIQLDTNNAAYYVLMANIYASAGMQEDAAKLEAMQM